MIGVLLVACADQGPPAAKTLCSPLEAGTVTPFRHDLPLLRAHTVLRIVLYPLSSLRGPTFSHFCHSTVVCEWSLGLMESMESCRDRGNFREWYLSGSMVREEKGFLSLPLFPATSEPGHSDDERRASYRVSRLGCAAPDFTSEIHSGGVRVRAMRPSADLNAL